jgi:tRNA G10  N-methylase Trm11
MPKTKKSRKRDDRVRDQCIEALTRMLPDEGRFVLLHEEHDERHEAEDERAEVGPHGRGPVWFVRHPELLGAGSVGVLGQGLGVEHRRIVHLRHTETWLTAKSRLTTKAGLPAVSLL